MFGWSHENTDDFSSQKITQSFIDDLNETKRNWNYLWQSAKFWFRPFVKSKRIPSKRSGFNDTAKHDEHNLQIKSKHKSNPRIIGIHRYYVKKMRYKIWDQKKHTQSLPLDLFKRNGAWEIQIIDSLIHIHHTILLLVHRRRERHSKANVVGWFRGCRGGRRVDGGRVGSGIATRWGSHGRWEALRAREVRSGRRRERGMGKCRRLKGFGFGLFADMVVTNFIFINQVLEV